jgi:hypothetical protein
LDIKSPWYVELYSLNDFGRLVCALEHAPLPTLSLLHRNASVFAVQTDFIEGRPVIFFAKNLQNKNGEYLAYRINGVVEEIGIVDFVANPSYVYSPIINIDKFPSRLIKGAKFAQKSGYLSIRLKDLASLAKVCAYKTLYDEPPLPLLLFEHKSDAHERIILGAAMSVNETDTLSYFYYVNIDMVPKDRFLRYSSQRSEQPSFSNRIDEHGYIYLKVIRLASIHPLVKLND